MEIFIKLTFDGDVPEQLFGVLPRFGVLRWTYTGDSWVSFNMVAGAFASELLQAFHSELLSGRGNLRSIEAKRVGVQRIIIA